jgi:hypothetical protein
MMVKNLKIGQKIIVGNFDSDYSAEVVSISNGKVWARVNFYGVERVEEINAHGVTGFYLAGVVE